MEGQYNLRSPAVKRLMREAQELREPTEQFFAQPLDDNLFEWHFTIRGPADSEFDGGIYHGRIILPPEYPMKPPSIILLTPNGRFETNKKICLSISGYHPESWQPSWSLRTALLAIIGFMPTHGNGAIGSLDYTADERKVLAKKSNDWKCSQCGQLKSILLPVTEASKALNKEAADLGSQIKLQGEKEKPAAESPDSVPNGTAQTPSVPASEAVAPLPGFDPRLVFAGRFPFPGMPVPMMPGTAPPVGAPPFWPPMAYNPMLVGGGRMPYFDPRAIPPPFGFWPGGFGTPATLRYNVPPTTTTQVTPSLSTTTSIYTSTVESSTVPSPMSAVPLQSAASSPTVTGATSDPATCSKSSSAVEAEASASEPSVSTMAVPSGPTTTEPAVDAGDPVPSGTELRQRHARRPPVVATVDQPADLHRPRSSALRRST